MLHHDNHKDIWPVYPTVVADFLKEELKIGKRYAVLDIHTRSSELTPLLLHKVHLMCSVTPEAEYHQILKQSYATEDNFLSLNATPDLLPIEDDAMHCVAIDDVLMQFDPIRVAKEFERILRLNSYVLFFQKRLRKQQNTFSKVYHQYLQDQKIETKLTSPLAVKPMVVDFFGAGLYTKDFEGQQYLNWQELLQYTDTLAKQHGLYYDVAALQSLFNEFEEEHRVKLAYNIHLSYGLFNKSVPDISLKKSIFFNVLRPFAFGFYLLIKANIYFWKYMKRLFGRKKIR